MEALSFIVDLAVRLKMKPCRKCGESWYGVYTSSSSGKIKKYCRTCQWNRMLAYNARLKAAGGHHTRKQWLLLLASFDSCPGCDRKWENIPDRPHPKFRNVWTKDHIVPLLQGGNNDIENIQPLCYQCNFGKGGRIKV